MLNGVNLSLYIGPAVPIPAPRSVVESLESVQVISPSGETQAGFELTFTLPKRSPLETLFLLTGGSSIPIVRVVIAVTIGGSTDVLIDGVMTNHEIRSGEGGTSKLIVKGKDLSFLMDYFPLDGLPFPAMPPALRVLVALAKYAVLGVIPLVIPSFVEDLPIPVERIPRQKGTDYQYIRQLANEAGYVFYMDPGPIPGTSKAYWGPEIRVGPAQPALNIDMDAHTNVKDLTFNFDKEKKEFPIVLIQNQATKIPIPIPIPDISPLNPPLGLIPPLPPKIKFLDDTAKQSPLQAVMTGLAYASQHSDAVFGKGSLDVVRYGRVLKSRQLVGVRGAGLAFDGLYFVKSVTHNIKRGDYQQSFELARDGLISTLPGGARMNESKKFFGKYRATVINNIDPLQIGRIQVIVPDVSSVIPTSWAMPCAPVAGINMGIFAVPTIGAGVWVEFEQGDPDYPIWVGCFWGTAAEVPVMAHLVPPAVPGITLQTTLKNGIVISDTPGPTGGIMIQTTTGAMISISDIGIIISNGKGAVINMTGPTVDVNLGALTVI